MQKVIVITGASAGIGAALAHELSGQGHRLALAARRREELEQTAREAGGALAVPTDATRREEVERLRDRTIAEFGRIDVWINNAGRGISKPVLQLTDADFDEMMTVNVKSALYGMQAAVPHFMERRAGHLINVSSFLGRVPMASIRSVYSAAKAALNSLTANLRTDLAAEYPDIHVSLVMPGIVKTGFAQNALGSSAISGAPTAPPAGPPPGSMQPQTAEEVAAAIARLIERPEAEIYTNPASPELVRRYYADVGAFEARTLARAR
ncbi:MAG TPA: SDR family oxidoreductase [Thermoanaerobaculia bacterium]|jgi:short-subunit dehydrogenase|nr:SDR family oxidoreductase [Thermoanaerobaculia bacterium]